ncbi:MAG: YaiI/YqxD family protein [Acutalibacteraceae bacterium]|nr:YaiI/YqxD family protein [Acutalibacteraceae bacterium]
MTVFIDADSCPVIRLAESICKKYSVPVTIMCDPSHIIKSDYSRVITIDAGANAVDLALINSCKKNDIVITQDYGLATLALGKGCYSINQNGMLYTDNNIDTLLSTRYITQKLRNSKAKHHIKGPKKRTKDNNNEFAVAFEKLIVSNIQKP